MKERSLERKFATVGMKLREGEEEGGEESVDERQTDRQTDAHKSEVNIQDKI